MSLEGSEYRAKDPNEAIGIVHGKCDYSLDHGSGSESGEKTWILDIF